MINIAGSSVFIAFWVSLACFNRSRRRDTRFRRSLQGRRHTPPLLSKAAEAAAIKPPFRQALASAALSGSGSRARHGREWSPPAIARGGCFSCGGLPQSPRPPHPRPLGRWRGGVRSSVRLGRCVGRRFALTGGSPPAVALGRRSSVRPLAPVSAPIFKSTIRPPPNGGVQIVKKTKRSVKSAPYALLTQN